MRRRDSTLSHCWICVFNNKGQKLFSKFYETIRRSAASRVMNRVTRLHRIKYSGFEDSIQVKGFWDATYDAFDRFMESEEDPAYFKKHYFSY